MGRPIVQFGVAAAVLFSIAAFFLPGSAALNIYYPGYRNDSLDYCLTLQSDTTARDCGLPAADAWCQALGYDRAIDFKGPADRVLDEHGAPGDRVNSTMAIKSKERCVAGPNKSCYTFITVNCIHDALFVNPSVNGQALDYCLDDRQENCGRAAADYFCTRKGFSHGSWSIGRRYKIIPNPMARDSATTTIQPKTGKTCDAAKQDCYTFATINCEK